MSFNWPADNLTVKEKVGVGTDTPTKKLEVVGKVKATEFVQADGTEVDPGFRTAL